MNITLPPAAAVPVIPSGSGVMRLNDLVSERAGVFINPFATAAQLAANFSCVQLLNAAASGRRLLVDMIIFSGGPSAEAQLRSHNVALTTDVGAWVAINPSGAAGNAHVFTDRVGALPGTLIVQFPKHSVVVAAYWSFDYPIMLDEDEGLVVCQPSVQNTMTCAFVGREV